MPSESNMKKNNELNTLSNIKNLSFLSLFTSTGTILCCALPALLVTIGAGAALSSLISTFPQIVLGDIHLGGCQESIRYMQEKEICCVP